MNRDPVVIAELENDRPSIFDLVEDDMDSFKRAREYDAHTSEATTYRPDRFEIEAARLAREEHDRKIDLIVARMMKKGSF